MTRNGPERSTSISSTVDQLLAAPPRLGEVRLLAIDGPSGAGKTTVAAAVMAELATREVSAALVPTDHFATWDEPVAWWPRLVRGVLEPLARGERGGYRKVDWTSGRPRSGPYVPVDPAEVLVLEGVSAGRTAVRPLLSLLCWVNGPDRDARLARALARDGEPSRRHLEAWQAFERGWFAVDQTNRHANTSIRSN